MGRFGAVALAKPSDGNVCGGDNGRSVSPMETGRTRQGADVIQVVTAASAVIRYRDLRPLILRHIDAAVSGLVS